MLVEKEVISPGTYWYTDEKTGLPRKLDVTPAMCKYWHEMGDKMLSAGLTIPVPCEHDFNAHPMTPAEKLKNNAGWVKEYRMKDGRLFSVLDIQDEEIAKKLPRTIRWTSPWFNSFTDGQGQTWNNVISHLALTTRPRIVKQSPFGSVAAALSIAVPTVATDLEKEMSFKDGFCLSRAGRIVERKKTKKLQPQYPIAFSLYSGAKFAFDDDEMDMDPLDDDGDEFEEEDDDGMDVSGLMDPLQDQTGDVAMEELLCDLLNALGVQMPDNVGESEFKRALYEATMSKIKELAGKAASESSAAAQDAANNTNSPAGNQGNPLIQQEQQPMYMSLEEINKLPDPMKSVALAMYAENQKLRTQVDASQKITESLRDAKLKEADILRRQRIALLSKLAPRTKADLESMIALPSMSLSMGDGGAVIDPMAQTLALLEKSLADMPKLLTSDYGAMSVQTHPTDNEMSQEAVDSMADSLARMMGCPPEKKAS